MKRHRPAVKNPKLGFLISSEARDAKVFKQLFGEPMILSVSSPRRPWRNMRPRKGETFPYHGPPLKYPVSFDKIIFTKDFLLKSMPCSIFNCFTICRIRLVLYTIQVQDLPQLRTKRLGMTLEDSCPPLPFWFLAVTVILNLIMSIKMSQDLANIIQNCLP